MKKVLKKELFLVCIVCLFAGLLCGTFGCAGDGEKLTGWSTPAELVGRYTEKYALTDGFLFDHKEHPMTETEVFSYYSQDGQAPDLSDAEEYAIYFDDSSYEGDTEIGVFRLKSGADKNKFLSFLRARVDALLEYSQRYPFDTAALKDAKFGTVGNYVYYVVVRDHAGEIESSLKASLKP